METFYCKTKIISGPGAVSSLKNMGIKRLFLVTDPYFAQNGQAQRTVSEANAEYTEIFDRVQPDPDVELAAAGTAKLREFKPDAIVCLGGGSAIDCAKAIRYFGKEDIPLIAIPTTSGSGSEVTDFAILTHGNIKHPLTDPKIRPDVAILDSELLNELPKSLIADSGFDVLSHALEGYVASGSGTITDCFAREAFRTAYEVLPKSFAGDKSVRIRMHEASCLAGLSFTQAGLGICHAMSHALGGVFHVPHGRLNAILLPAVIEYNAAFAGAKYAQIARSAGIAGSADVVAVRNLRNGLIRLRRDLKLPETLAQAGVNLKTLRSETENIISAAMADVCAGTNPAPADRNALCRILNEVAGRG